MCKADLSTASVSEDARGRLVDVAAVACCSCCSSCCCCDDCPPRRSVSPDGDGASSTPVEVARVACSSLPVLLDSPPCLSFVNKAASGSVVILLAAPRCTWSVALARQLDVLPVVLPGVASSSSCTSSTSAAPSSSIASAAT